jgi:hypothetical protein
LYSTYNNLVLYHAQYKQEDWLTNLDFFSLNNNRTLALTLNSFFQGEVFGFCRFSRSTDSGLVLFVTAMHGNFLTYGPVLQPLQQILT